MLTTKEVDARLGEMSKLEYNYDGDRAEPPNLDTIDRARDLANALVRSPDEVDPDVMGGVAFFFYLGEESDLTVTVFNTALGSGRVGTWGILHHHVKTDEEDTRRVKSFSDDTALAKAANDILDPELS